jgi:hypothetical protein
VRVTGTCSSSHFRATTAFAGSRSVNSYVSHSWYSLFDGFVVTRRTSSFGSYQYAPQDVAFFEKMNVHSSAPVIAYRPYEPAGSDLPCTLISPVVVKTVPSLAPARHGQDLQSLKSSSVIP